MAATDRRPRTPDELRREIEGERALLTDSVEALRDELDVAGKLRAKLPLVAAGGVGLGFVVAGGLRATARLLRKQLRR